MPEGQFSLLQEVYDSPGGRRMPSARMMAFTAAAGLSLGVLLALCLFTLFSSHSMCSLPPHGSDSGATTLAPVTYTQTKKYFIFTEEKKNWYQALADCHRRGMMFAEVNNEKEHQELVNEFKTYGNETTDAYWLGGTDLGHGSFVWMSSGSPVLSDWWYHDEHVLEPNNHVRCDGEAEHCVELLGDYDYKMNDNCCLELKTYVCQQLGVQVTSHP